MKKVKTYKSIFRESLNWKKIKKIYDDFLGGDVDQDFTDYELTSEMFEKVIKSIKEDEKVLKGGSPEVLAFYAGGDMKYYFFSDGSLEYVGRDLEKFISFLIAFSGDNGDPNMYIIK